MWFLMYARTDSKAQTNRIEILNEEREKKELSKDFLVHGKMIFAFEFCEWMNEGRARRIRKENCQQKTIGMTNDAAKQPNHGITTQDKRCPFAAVSVFSVSVALIAFDLAVSLDTIHISHSKFNAIRLYSSSSLPSFRLLLKCSSGCVWREPKARERVGKNK